MKLRTLTMEWTGESLILVDQRKLPLEEVYVECKDFMDVARAIKEMIVRGAPAIGATAAFGYVLGAKDSKGSSFEEVFKRMKKVKEVLSKTRPTAVNLFWAINRILEKAWSFPGNVKELMSLVVSEAQKMADEDVATNRLIGKHGARLIRDGDVILTHCNAGALATVDYGTALGVVRAALEQGKNIEVIATETRPKLQGARLTAYELKRDGVPVTLITDNMVGYVMYKGLIDKVIVGADRVVQDAVINKIGTYNVAVLAKEHGIPFYVAAPKSTFDVQHVSADVVIEERKPEEVTQIGLQRIAPEGIKVLNPAFDITPLKYVTAIICESGILYKEDFNKLKA